MLPSSYDQALDQLAHLETPPQTTRESNPLFLTSLAIIRGLRPPRLDGSFSCCELFAGQGLGAVMSAAVFPKASFFVVAPAAVNAAAGGEVASRAGLDNVTHIHADAADLQDLDIPACDFLCLHEAHYLGGAAGLQSLAPTIDRLLAPGGLLSVSYQSLPGMHEEALVRRMLRQLVQNAQGRLDARLKTALTQAKDICTASGMTERMPQLAAMLNRLEEGLSPQAARELLHPDWQPLFFHEVNNALSSAGLQHLGQAALHYDMPSLLMPGGRLEAYAPHEGTAMGEFLKGLMAGQTMRYDVFHKGAREMGSVEHSLALGDMEFGRLTPSSQRLYEAPTPHGVVQLQPELVDPVYDALESGAAAYSQMLQALPQQENTAELLMQLTAMLIDTGQLHPLLPHPLHKNAIGPRIQLLDRQLLERFIVDSRYCFSVAPRLGGGMHLSWETQAMRLILYSGVSSEEEAAAMFLEQMHGSGRQLLHDGRPIDSQEERMARSLELWRHFQRDTAPLLAFLQDQDTQQPAAASGLPAGE